MAWYYTELEKIEYIKELQKLAASVQPLDMINHAEKCDQCKLLLLKTQSEIAGHMNIE